MASTALTSTALALALAVGGIAKAETIGGALSKAYLSNPQLNTQRASVRASDEALPRANAAKLPTVAGSAQAGYSATKIDLPYNGGLSPSHEYETTLPRSYGASVTQTLFDGNRANNNISATESQILAAREQLRGTEQSVLLFALTYYMDVMRDTAILGLNKSNVQVLTEQLRQTQDRFNVGELTRTDVAQAQSALATAQAQELSAETTLTTSIANYRLYIGDEPKNLQPVAPLTRQLPRTINEAIAISQSEHPSIVYQLHTVDAAEMNVKLAQSQLLPSATLQGSVAQEFDPSGISGSAGYRVLNGSVVANLNVPIYDGGATYASIRGAKETLGAQELQADQARDQVRQAVVQSWGANLNSAGIIKADKAAVDAAEVALVGVREEAKVGQRTTLDVLNAQLLVLQQRTQLVRDQHDQVVNSYTLLSSIGRLSPRVLGLGVLEYDPRVHYEQVKYKQVGGDTPEGK